MQPLNFFLAFIVVLGLIGLATWLVRRFAANRIGASNSRGRMPRLAVIDAAAVDSRRRLVLIRRDNVEHLLMIGGPSDIVVEPNIVRASPAREQVPPRPLPATDFIAESEPPPRPEPMEYIEPAPEPPQRQARPAFADELRRPAPPPVAERRDPLAGFAPEPSVRPEPALREPPPLREPPLREPSMREPSMREPSLRDLPHREPTLREPRAMPRTEPVIPRPPRAEISKTAPTIRTTERPATSAASAAAAAAADKNLAEMAQRLEAALRRPGAEARPAAAPVAPPTAPEPPASHPASRPVAAHAAEEDIASAPADDNADTPKASFKNLEDEMASLLGRPKTPS